MMTPYEPEAAAMQACEERVEKLQQELGKAILARTEEQARIEERLRACRIAVELDSQIRYERERAEKLQSNCVSWTERAEMGWRGLQNIYSVIEGRECDQAVALGRATSSVVRLKEQAEKAEAELKRVAADKEYLFAAQVGNEWHERLQVQQRQIVQLCKDRHRLAHAIDPRSETPRLERSVESLEKWADDDRAAAKALSAEVVALKQALAVIRADLRLNMKCHNPPDDGSDDPCDGDDCILCENLQTIEAALSAGGKP